MAGDSPTLEDLKKQARDLSIEGRSSMDREELEHAIAAATAGGRSLEPATADEVGRPELVDVAAERASSRKIRRVIGEDPTTQEDN